MCVRVCVCVYKSEYVNVCAFNAVMYESECAQHKASKTQTIGMTEKLVYPAVPVRRQLDTPRFLRMVDRQKDLSLS